MDFFQQQAKAHHKTKLLVFYFTLAVISIILMIYGVAVFVNFYAGSKHDYYIEQRPFTFWNPQLFAGVAVGTLAVIFFGSAYKTLALAGGGGAVAESLGGRLVNPNATNPDERRLLNVVEEMAIAAGVPVPQVYVLDNEDYINAFAAGHTTGDAVVAVTRHCMTKLTRDELQGVIGHEVKPQANRNPVRHFLHCHHWKGFNVRPWSQQWRCDHDRSLIDGDRFVGCALWTPDPGGCQSPA
jgi:Zn-dependent protease with chaperone function